MCVELYRWSIELEGIFVLNLAPRWVRHSYISKNPTNDPLCLWVIKPFYWRLCWGAIAWGEYSRVCLFALSLSSFIFCSKLFSIFVMDMQHETPKNSSTCYSWRWVKEICPRGNNKVVICISLYHDKCLLFMLELY